MKQFTVELDDMICCWLDHISKITGVSVEKIICNGIFHQIAALEDNIYKIFTYRNSNRVGKEL